MALSLEEKEPVVLLRTEDAYQYDLEDGIAGYTDELLAVVASFANGGIPQGCDAMSMAGKSKRQDVSARLYATVVEDEDGTERLAEVGFKTRGCLAITACASVVCTLARGKTFDEALSLRPEHILDVIVSVPPDKGFAPYFALCALKGVIGDHLLKKGASLEELDERVVCDGTEMGCMLCEHCSLRTLRLEERARRLGLASEGERRSVSEDA